MLRHRLILGPLMILAMLLGLWLDEAIDASPAPAWFPSPTMPPAVVVTLVVAVLALLAGRELARILRDKGVQAADGMTCGVAFIGVLVAAALPNGGSAAAGAATVGAAIALVLLGSMVYYARSMQPNGLIAAAGGALLAFCYIGLLLGFLIAIRREHTCWTLAWVLLVTKMTDVGAYTVGRLFGTHKLVPWLSPGKTWEGLGGALAFGCCSGPLLGMAFSALGRPGMPAPLTAAGLGLAFAVVGHTGDLMASALKRDAGRKDAGGSVPGFGGILDVLDSVLLVGPAAYWALRMA